MTAAEPAVPISWAALGGELLGSPVSSLPGAGRRRAEALDKAGLRTVLHLMLTPPRDWQDRSRPTPVAELEEGTDAVVRVRVLHHRERRTRRGPHLLQTACEDDTGRITAITWGRPWVAERLPPGTEVWLHGRVRRRKGLQLTVQEFEVEGEDGPAGEDGPPDEAGAGADTDDGDDAEAGEGGTGHVGRVVGRYRQVEGVSPAVMRGLCQAAVDRHARRLRDPLPDDIRAAHDLPDLAVAVRAVHLPDDLEEAERGRRRLAWDELFLLELSLAARRDRARRADAGCGPVSVDAEVDARIRALYPWDLTGAQERCIREVRDDLDRPWPMHRLLQGDVGAGKTAVAVYALLAAVAAGRQAALMVPTELLARQHMRTLSGLLAEARVHPVLIEGGATGAARRRQRETLRTSPLVVGTHALLEPDAEFDDLAVVVIDEQHKFGVTQRARLRRKGANPHTLVMTATPIPRTLALTLFGDLDVSILDELPPGRTPPITRRVSDADRTEARDFVRDRLARGERAYFVFPAIGDEDGSGAGADGGLATARAAAARLERLFGDRGVGLVHGRMPREEQDRVMDDFRAGRIQVLVSTSVVEVGVDVPEATIMWVEDAGRFGLAQLHQLRGRVGRGGGQAWFLPAGEPPGETAEARLAALERTTDGFEIAEEDLRLRGPGEFFGVRQSGLPELTVADPLTDLDLLASAREAAFGWVERGGPDPEQAAALGALARARFGDGLNLAWVG